ncbi:MAG: YdcF family protein [Deltaproteobacteria bacterium]|nr:YdcF family protein [Deltaproteobacteria bacterium]
MSRLKLLCTLFFLTLVIIEASLFYQFVQNMNVKTKTFEKVDAIVVLAGAQGRIPFALKLFEEGKADYFIISGVGKKFKLETHKVYGKLATHPQVFVDKSSANTLENALETEKLLRKFYVSKMALVTSNYHMYRSLYVFRKIFPQDIEIYPYVLKSKNFDMDYWHKRFVSSFIVFKEFLAYQWYKTLL